MPMISSKNNGVHSLRLPFCEKGFSLLEVLIAVIVLAIGLLGIGGLQVLSLKNNHSAYLRSQATYLAYDIIDSIRVNPDGIASYATAATDAPASHQSCESTTANCTTAQMVTHDLNIWKCSLGGWDSHATCTTLGITGLLPGGTGVVAVSGNDVTVTVAWIDDRDGTSTTSLAVSTRI
ncbi:MAG: type IV pilus modification protein PilV [Sedimenticola sp.]|nr:type IV pilus modification protein PilV [Sedimenticola sp.]